MVKREETLDSVFSALSSAVRRRTLDTLGHGASSASELAAPHGMSLAGFLKHLRVLQEAGLVACSKEGRIVRCALAPKRLRIAADWVQQHEKFWTARLDSLGRYLYHQQETHSDDSQQRAGGRRRSQP